MDREAAEVAASEQSALEVPRAAHRREGLPPQTLRSKARTERVAYVE